MINQLDLIGVYGISGYQQQDTYSFQVYMEYFTHTDHIIRHKTSLNKYGMTQIIRNVLSNHNGLKLEIRNRLSKESPHIWKLKTHFEITNWKRRNQKRNLNAFELNFLKMQCIKIWMQLKQN